MRHATLLVVLACGCATSSSTGAPSGGASEPADAKERGWRSPASESGAAGGGPRPLAGATIGTKKGNKVTGPARHPPSGFGVYQLVIVQDSPPRGAWGVKHQEGGCNYAAEDNC